MRRIHPWSLTCCPWNGTVGQSSFPFGVANFQGLFFSHKHLQGSKGQAVGLSRHWLIQVFQKKTCSESIQPSLQDVQQQKTRKHDRILWQEQKQQNTLHTSHSIKINRFHPPKECNHNNNNNNQGPFSTHWHSEVPPAFAHHVGALWA